MKLIAINLCVAILLLSAVQAHEPTKFSIVKNEEGLTVLEGIRPVLTYQRAVRARNGKWPRANYVHPLYSLDGEVMTEDFPDDHGHHRGIFWAWHQVIVDGEPMGDAWLCEDFQWDTIQALASTNGDRAQLDLTTLWKSPKRKSKDGALVPFALEQTGIIVHPLDKGLRFIDFDICLSGLITGVKIGGSDDEKGYGGFSPRIKLTGDDVFLSTQGKLEPTKLQLEAGPWIDISTAKQGLTILTHESNPGFPQPWILRRDRSMQNATFPGRDPIELPTDSILRLRYRLIIHRGNLGRARIEKLQCQYQSQP